MAVLALDFTLDPKLSETNSLSVTATNIEKSMKEVLMDLNLVTAFNLEGGLVKIFTAEGGSVVNLRLFPTGLVSLNVDYFKGDKDNASATFEIVQKLESNIIKTVNGIKWTRSLPSIQPDKALRFYLTSDSRVIEYDIDKLVFEEVTPYQKVQIVHSTTLGNILVLDNLQNLSEADLVYTETLMQRGKENFKDKNILILGGGDGALLYELLKEQPKEVIMLEIDEVVMKACAKYMRSVCGTVLDNYEGPNYKIIVGDCMLSLEQYAKEGKKFDYIFGDLTDVPISIDQSKELWSFINQALVLSFSVLKADGKFMTHVTGTSSWSALDLYAKQLEKIYPPVKFTMDKAFVPSFYEEWIFCQIGFESKE
ncbi:spermine synthase [Euwallacea fornicatus]|uniref:spermine synthase n=1 Tax=Euwallacea fornicatus TaxID=995702 RepID=UPI00338EBE1C